MITSTPKSAGRDQVMLQVLGRLGGPVLGHTEEIDQVIVEIVEDLSGAGLLSEEQLRRSGEDFEAWESVATAASLDSVFTRLAEG